MHRVTVRHKSLTPGDRLLRVRRAGLLHDVRIQSMSRNTLPHTNVDRRRPGTGRPCVCAEHMGARATPQANASSHLV